MNGLLHVHGVLIQGGLIMGIYHGDTRKGTLQKDTVQIVCMTDIWTLEAYLFGFVCLY